MGNNFEMNEEKTNDSIAIIGIAGRFPGAESTEALWDVLREGRETISHFSKEKLAAHEHDLSVLDLDNYVGARGTLSNVDMFDAAFFGYTPKEAMLTDPQQRIWLETAWQALEQAGYTRPGYDGVIGVFTGTNNSSYLLYNLLRTRTDIESFVRSRTSDDFATMLSNGNAYLATRTAYKLNLKGPAINVQTACSTSLVAIVMAVQSLLQFETDVCIAGGVTVAVPQTTGYLYQEGAIQSRDGHCRPFDINSCGTVFSSGVGAVVLKRLDEAIAHRDPILAVIRGAAMNNDGTNKVGFTAPSVEGQAEAITLAHCLADVDPQTITFIEAHGTATPLGDPIEIAGLNKAFGACDGQRQFCGIGSVKSNIGHADSAAGVASLIKTVLALEHRQIPATIHFEKPNPNLNLADSPFYVVDKLTEWRSEYPLRAGVSSFGVGGTNAHVVVEEAPARPASGPSRDHQLLLLSAKSDNALSQMASNLSEAFSGDPDVNVADAAWTLHRTRRSFSKRLFAVCDNRAESAATALQQQPPHLFGRGEAVNPTPPVVFAFPGQGSHYHGMGASLARSEPVFREALDACCRIANRHIETDLSALFTTEISPEAYAEQMGHNGIAQLAIFSIDYSLAKLWLSLGIEPGALLGHSLGEWPAACLAGLLSLEHAIEAVWHRGRLMQQVAGNGAALTVFAGIETIAPHLNDEVHIAAENAPSLSLLSGPKSAIDQCRQELEASNINCRLLDIEVAVHSPALDEVIGPFEDILRGLDFSQPTIPILSTATGAWLTNEQATDPSFWARQMRTPVKFTAVMEALWQSKDYLVLEVGPGVALTALSKQNTSKRPRPIVNSLGKDATTDEHTQLLRAVGSLWTHGVEIDGDAYWREEERCTVRLPAYAFDRQSYWVDALRSGTASSSTSSLQSVKPKVSSMGNDLESASNRPSLSTPFVSPRSPEERLLSIIWSDALGILPVGVLDEFRDLGGDSLGAVSIMEKIHKETGKSLALRTLTTASNIEELAKLISLPEQTRRSFKCLVPIIEEGTLPPVYWLPGGGGLSVMSFQMISEKLGPNQPVYGLEADTNTDSAPTTVPDIVRAYREEIQQHQPHGPYYLLGFSLGAYFAYELAVQLRQVGEEVGILVVFDADVPITVRNRDRYKIFAQRAKYRINEMITKRDPQTQTLKRCYRMGVRKIPIVGERIREREAREEKPSIYKAIIDRNVAAIDDYAGRPLPIFDGKVTCILARNTSLHGVDDDIDPRQGWRHFATQGIEVHRTDGNHLSMLVEPDVDELASVVRSCLRGAYND
jgi:phthiocerol/phenolphthiocerol synthesis type-I polyketide synthase E